ncbi:response regulator [Gilvimarinus chinensis]|uniref:response regulator n=1 Tax=Gilvimarinus chinensis TaxID=396005 RepID=UPI0003772D51|nr:response regulator [Gilvimarinus chinensis]
MSVSDIAEAKVLVVDNFDNFRMAVRRLLQQLGCLQVDTAVNAVDAWRKCRALEYDLVLCDFSLGRGKNGLQLLEQLREERQLKPSAIFILLSAEYSKALVMAATDAEPDAFLTKPVTTKKLRDRLLRILQQRRAMAPLWLALNAGDKSKAIEICQLLLHSKTRHQTFVQKLLGQLLIEDSQLASAEALYRQVMADREWDWAQVGMARICLANHDWQRAEQWLEQALVSNRHCISALDWLAKIYADNGDEKARQAVLQQAVELSPLSVQRQSQLGQQALINRYLPLAASALRQAVRLGLYSCYDQPDTHLAFVRSCAELSYADREQAQAFYRDVNRVLEEFESRFSDAERYLVALRSAECAFKAVSGDADSSRRILQRLQSECDLGTLSSDVLFDWVSAADFLQDLVLRNELIDYLCEHRCEEHTLQEKVDLFLNEPVSAKKRERLAVLNTQGIGLYEKQEYLEALSCFEQAFCEFPRHGGVALNLLQTLVGALKNVQGDKSGHRRRGDGLVERLQQWPGLDAAQRDRFNRLRSQWVKLA